MVIDPITRKLVKARAMKVAKDLIKAEIKASGRKVSFVKAKDVSDAAAKILPSITVGQLLNIKAEDKGQ